MRQTTTGASCSQEVNHLPLLAALLLGSWARMQSYCFSASWMTRTNSDVLRTKQSVDAFSISEHLWFEHSHISLSGTHARLCVCRAEANGLLCIVGCAHKVTQLERGSCSVCVVSCAVRRKSHGLREVCVCAAEVLGSLAADAWEVNGPSALKRRLGDILRWQITHPCRFQRLLARRRTRRPAGDTCVTTSARGLVTSLKPFP